MLKSFHDKWYAPNNAVLIVVGNVDLNATLGRVRALFGWIKRKKLPPRPKFVLGPAKAASFSIDTDRPNATQFIAIRMPGLDSKDFPALELLADVLNSHRFALYGMVPEGKAVETEFSLDALPKAGVGYAAVTVPAGGDAQGLEAGIRAIVADVREDGSTADLVA